MESLTLWSPCVNLFSFLFLSQTLLKVSKTEDQTETAEEKQTEQRETKTRKTD